METFRSVGTTKYHEFTKELDKYIYENYLQFSAEYKKSTNWFPTIVRKMECQFFPPQCFYEKFGISDKISFGYEVYTIYQMFSSETSVLFYYDNERIQFGKIKNPKANILDCILIAGKQQTNEPYLRF